MDNAKYDWCRQRLPQDPGQAGKDQKASYMEMLAGFDVCMIPESGDKATRAEPMAAQWQHGMFDLVAVSWRMSDICFRLTILGWTPQICK